MSLDVYLTLESEKVSRGSGIFVRQDGATKEISKEEWDAAFPGLEPVIVAEGGDNEVYWANITHNVGKMAAAAGIYEALWCPEDIGITQAHELIQLLGAGLVKLIEDPDFFKQFNPSNGWGSYEGLVAFVEDYLRACIKFPAAIVRVSR